MGYFDIILDGVAIHNCSLICHNVIAHHNQYISYDYRISVEVYLGPINQITIVINDPFKLILTIDYQQRTITVLALDNSRTVFLHYKILIPTYDIIHLIAKFRLEIKRCYCILVSPINTFSGSSLPQPVKTSKMLVTDKIVEITFFIIFCVINNL